MLDLETSFRSAGARQQFAVPGPLPLGYSRSGRKRLTPGGRHGTAGGGSGGAAAGSGRGGIMVELFGRSWSRTELMARTGGLAQVAGVELNELADRPERARAGARVPDRIGPEL